MDAQLQQANPEENYEDYEEDFEQYKESINKLENLQSQQLNLSQQNLTKNNDLDFEEAETHSRVIGSQEVLERQSENREERMPKRDLKDAGSENKIKDTINLLTKNILLSKQEIVHEISTINKYQEENEKEIKYREKGGIKYKLKGGTSEQESSSHHLQPMKKRLLQIEKEKVLAQLREKEDEKRRKKQIYLMQKMERKEKQHMDRNRSRIKEHELEQRIIYEQRFMSRKGYSPEADISEDQLKALEDVFIQRIKDRLNMGKSKKRPQYKSQVQIAPRNERRKKVTERQEVLKKYNKKINQDNKFKEKILINLRIKREQEELEKTPVKEKNQPQRIYYSAPNLRKPLFSDQARKTKTLYKEKPGSVIFPSIG